MSGSQSAFCRCFIIELQMQHELCMLCKSKPVEVGENMKNEPNNNAHIPSFPYLQLCPGWNERASSARNTSLCAKLKCSRNNSITGTGTEHLIDPVQNPWGYPFKRYFSKSLVLIAVSIVRKKCSASKNFKKQKTSCKIDTDTRWLITVLV